MIEVTSANFNVGDVVSALQKDQAGAVVVFVGIVKGVSEGARVDRLYVESYESAAKSRMEEIGREARQRFRIVDVSMIHRLGWMEPGDNIVAIAVSSIGRKDAFLACEWILEQVKSSAPIWKKEVTDRGERWISDG